MSKWRQKGFVQDSDDEEEESQLETQDSQRDGSLQGRVERVDDIANAGKEQEEEGTEVLRSAEKDEGSGVPKSYQPAEAETPKSPVTKRSSPRRPTTSPFTPAPTHELRREPTESPDPLQSSPTPKSHRSRRIISSQLLGSPAFAAKSAPPGSQQNEDIAVSSQTPSDHSLQLRLPNPVKSGVPKTSNILSAFGIGPLSDDDEALSDPPTDLESPETEPVANQPHRKTAVRVVIPSSTALQKHILEQEARREFRQRKPIQLHPYALEDALYRKEVQNRGLKPVARPRSPERRTVQQDAETQEKDFDPNETPSNSPPELEIPVSTPVQKPRKDRPQGSSARRRASDPPRSRLPATQLHLPHTAKRRKLNVPATQAAVVPTSIFNDIARRDIWSIPPNSPPNSISPPNGHRSARRMGSLPATTPAPNLPTPSTSSVFQEDPHPPHGSDTDAAPHSTHRSSGELRRPTRIILSDLSSSDSESASEAPQNDHELRKVGKKIKGVLPASWLRFDRMAQERRNAQARERERARTIAALSPEPSEPQRGVAQRITKRAGGGGRSYSLTTPAKDIVVVSDGSDEDNAPHYNQTRNVHEPVEEATALAAAFDSRYADDNSDNMENDRLHLFTLAGTGSKRKKQTKLTAAFDKAKRRKTVDGTARKNHAGASGRKRVTSKKSRRTPPPAMSVVDVDISPSKQGGSIPHFLRLARRQALRRPDLARQSPRSKEIHLHSVRDTEDANATLEQWRRGVLKPKVNAPSRPKTTRSPLANVVDNQQYAQQPTQEAKEARRSDALSEARSQISDRQRPANRPAGLGLFHRSPTQRTRHPEHTRKPPKPHRVLERSLQRGHLPYRTGQLEGDESVFGRDHRKIAFEKGLRQADHLAPALGFRDHSFMNPQLARFLADDDAVLPPLPSAKDVGEQPTEEITNQVAKPRKRLVRKKAQAQRVDVDAREFRQPSEPAVQDIVVHLVADGHEEVVAVENQVVLQGLGPYGVRYPTTFDVTPLQSETYFHSSTLVGSEDLKRALSLGRVGSRDLDEVAGYCTITNDATSIRCGPWNDETCSALSNMAMDIMTPFDNEAVRSEPAIQQESLMALTRFLRSFIHYTSVHLSFSDPVDRKNFAAKTHQLVFSLFDQISVVYANSDHAGSDPSFQRSSLQGMVCLLVLSVQTYNTATTTVVDESMRNELQALSRNIARFIVAHTVRKGIPELGNFLDQNKRHAARQNGIQGTDVLVEGVVVCMHSLDGFPSPGASFWDLVNLELSSTVRSATDIHRFEATWATLFTLVPFIDIDVSGIPSRDRRENFLGDDWSCISTMLRRVFELYPATCKKWGSTLNDYVRAILARCHRLIKYWCWQRPEAMLNAVFDFFGKNGLRQLQREPTSGSASFLDVAAIEQSFGLEPSDSSFHVALKCLALGLRGMRKTYTEKRLRSFVFRLIPNHGRSYPKDQSIDEESLAALRNHHDLLYTLYWTAPPSCRPKLDHIRCLVSHETSHREACRVNVRAWANLTTFQLSVDEPYASAKPFALWHKDIMHQTLKQYRLAKTEADEYLEARALDGTTDVSAVMVRNAMEKNQEQVIATLRDCIAGMRKALRSAWVQTPLDQFLIDSEIVHLLELPHLEDRRLVNVIRETLAMLQEYAKLYKKTASRKEIQQTSEESQDYGDFPDLNDLDGLESQSAAVTQQRASLDFLQKSLWHLLSNAFGAEISPDDNLLMDCIDTWVVVADGQVASGARSWSYYIDSFSQVSWQQLRDTEQTRKFGPYFLSVVANCDSTSYEEHRHDFITAILLSLVDRESMLRFQHRLLHAVVRIDQKHPLLKSLPFFCSQENDEWDITADTLRSRRLALISSILSNIRDDLHATTRTSEVRRTYAALLKDFMNRMKCNYQQLRQGTTVTGAYVEFVQKIVQFLKQYTGDICPVSAFFTDSVAFPLPSTDPTYVVGRLCGYAPKASDLGTAKQLSVFVQTVAQQAAADNQQVYLVNQLTTAMCSDDVPAADRAALRSVFLQGIFPAYLEQAFLSSVSFLIARPILEALPAALGTMMFDLRITHLESLASIVGSVIAVSHAFIRGTELLLVNQRGQFEDLHVVCSLRYMLESMASLIPLLDYISRRTSTGAHSSRPPIVTYMQELSKYIAELLQISVPYTIPHYLGDAHTPPPDSKHSNLLAFCKRGLDDSIKANWSESAGAICFGQGQARREVVFGVGGVEEERECLGRAVEGLRGVLGWVYGEGGERDDVDFDVVV